MRVTEHWLTHARGRIIAGDDELDVLADYGWVQITDSELDAIRFFATYGGPAHRARTLRNLLERLK